MITRTTALLVAGALLAPPALILGAATPARADSSDRGTCSTGTHELEVDREDGRYEVSADLERLRPGSRWTIVLKQDGRRFAKVARTADVGGDLGADRNRPDTPGPDVFRLKAVSASGVTCTATVTVA